MSMNNANILASLRGLREDDARVSMGGLREDDARVSMDGLRESDADISLDGLRESDADIALDGLREDDADVSLGRRRKSIIKKVAKKQPYGQAYTFVRKDIKMDGLRESDADVSLDGLREDDANVSLQGLREADAMITLGGLRQGLGNEMLGEFEVGEYAIDGLGRAFIKPIKSAVVFRRESAAMREQRGRFERMRPSALLSPMKRLHPVKIEGTHQMAGIFDFLKPTPSFEEFSGRIRTLLARWTPLKTKIDRLPDQQRVAVEKQLVDMRATAWAEFPRYIAEGPAGVKRERLSRLARHETVLPTIEKLVAQLQSTQPSIDAGEEIDRASEAVRADVANRVVEASGTQAERILVPVAIGVGSTAALAGVLYLIFK